ncbi:MAG: heme-binding protein [Acidobacteria bacterium]|nr:heme-binding protein [Acidobacteriota bacterium]
MRKALILAGLIAGAALFSFAQLASKKSMTLGAAKKIAAACEAEAMANKWNVVIAILDDGANLVYLQRMDGTQIGSVNVAIQKAESSVRFKRPTKAFEDALKGGRQAILRLPGALPVEGGIPLMRDGAVIGAIGVSGVQSFEDAQIATAGVKAFDSMQ